MITVGINKNVLLSKAEINDRGTLVLNFTNDLPLEDDVEIDEDDPLNHSAGVRNANGTNIMLWSVKVDDIQTGGVREASKISMDLVSVRDQLQHLLSGYVSIKEAKLNPYVGIDTSGGADVFNAKIQTQAVCDKIYNNLITQFIEKLKGIGEERLSTEKFRLLLVRTSVGNHYGTLRKRYLDNNPFWESMQIPDEASKLKFNAYELKNGLDSGEPVKKEGAAAAAATDDGLDDDLGIR